MIRFYNLKNNDNMKTGEEKKREINIICVCFHKIRIIIFSFYKIIISHDDNDLTVITKVN